MDRSGVRPYIGILVCKSSIQDGAMGLVIDTYPTYKGAGNWSLKEETWKSYCACWDFTLGTKGNM